MPIYTKTGDKGETSLFGGARVPKTHPQIEASGTIDELTSLVGLVATKLRENDQQELLRTIQHDLYQIMSHVSGFATSTLEHLPENAQRFEKVIDEYTKSLPELREFILPGGTELSGWFHVLRTQTRKAERAVIRAFETYNAPAKKQVVQYLNRLSDLFFTLARTHTQGKESKAKL